jgi:iron complex transport system substrate-binding protein
MQRVLSLDPAGTDMMIALGLESWLVGVTHQCDLPEGIELPRVTRCSIDRSMDSRQIDDHVRQQQSSGTPVVLHDSEAIAALRPDLILVQDLCSACGIIPQHLRLVLESHPQVESMALAPRDWSEILESIDRLGHCLEQPKQAESLVRRLEERRQRLVDNSMQRPKRRSVGLEWLEPLYGIGHWTIELLKNVGLIEQLGEAGEKSHSIDWNRLMEVDPDCLLVACCGLDANRAQEEFQRISKPGQWLKLRAVDMGKILFLDGNRGFSRPGPFLIDRLEEIDRWLTSDSSQRVAMAPEATRQKLSNR